VRGPIPRSLHRVRRLPSSKVLGFVAVAALGLFVPVAATIAMSRLASDPPVGELSITPTHGTSSTDITLEGSCGRSLGDDPASGVRAYWIAPGVDTGESEWQANGTLNAVGAPSRLDRAEGTFTYDRVGFVEGTSLPEAFLLPGDYVFVARCVVIDSATLTVTAKWMTPPAIYCLSDPHDVPQRCPSRGLGRFAKNIDAWGSFAGRFLGQIATDFTPPPTTTTTTAPAAPPRRPSARPPTTTPTTAPHPICDPSQLPPGVMCPGNSQPS
jgi:hypothetical protein